MFVTTRALLIPAIFLLGLEGAALAHYGHCAGDRCYAAVLQTANYSDAERHCNDSGGQLLNKDQELDETLHTLHRLLRAKTPGRFWLYHGDHACATFCWFMSMDLFMISLQPCRDELHGYICQYTNNEPCGSVHARPQVTYVALAGFEVKDSDTFPQGTIATTFELDRQHPASKHVCFAGSWWKAPWSCEVFNGGCEHGCNGTNTCTCPQGRALHRNNITCAEDTCAQCQQGCQKEGDSYACTCKAGYRLARDGRSCVDVDECGETNPCPDENHHCLNTEGSYQCECVEDFEEEDGACVNVSICTNCEHLCEKLNGVYECKCMAGFKVSPKDPTRCEQHCAASSCPARCDPNTDSERTDMQRCFCPEGYILDPKEDAIVCADIDECAQEDPCHQHTCVNTFGSFSCICDEGYELDDERLSCRPTFSPLQPEDLGSGEGSTYIAPVDFHLAEAPVPVYVKVGSVLGIAVFLLLGAGLMYLLWRNATKRCGSFKMPSLKGRDIDIFYLQQMSTETYKRLSVDRQLKNDPQRV